MQIPDWQAFVPGMRAWAPDASGPGRVVVVLSPPAARRDRWSGRMTLDLLDVWGDSGHRVVLADCVLEHPTLHREAGLANEEGVVDAALFGASVSKVARAAPGRSFYLISAGSPSVDPSAVATSLRWLRVEQGFRDAGVTLVLFLRAGCAGAAAFLARADDVIVLSDGADLSPAPDGLDVGRVRAHLGPEPSEEPVAEDASPPPEPEAFEGHAASDSHHDPSAPLALSTPAAPSDTNPDPDPSQVTLAVVPADDPTQAAAGVPAADAPTDLEPGASSEGGPDGSGPAEPERPADPETGASATTPSLPRSASATPGRRTGAKPKARRTLALVLVAVVILVLVLVLVGVMGSG